MGGAARSDLVMTGPVSAVSVQVTTDVQVRGVPWTSGSVVTVTPLEAVVLLAAKRARLLPRMPERRRHAPAAPTPSKRVYKRRDLQAESS